ncbi:MAG: hypothetical protein U0793_20960 [Gemmataceae bacterium]
MPILVSCSNPECRQQCVVPDEFAGRLVRCPKCPALIQAPLQPTPEQRQSIPADDFNLDLGEFRFGEGPPAGMPPPPPPAAPDTDAIGILAAFLRRCGVNKAGTVVLGCALGCCLFLVLFTFLPWQTIAHPDDLAPGLRLGVVTIGGAFTLFLTLGLLAFVVTTLLLRKRPLFEIGLWILPTWGALSALWRVLEIVTAYGRIGLSRYSAGFGLFFALVASIGLAGTAGFVAFSRLGKRR